LINSFLLLKGEGGSCKQSNN